MSAKANPAAETADFKNLIDCLAVGAEADARLNELVSLNQQNYLDLVDGTREDYVKFTTAKTSSEAAVFDTMDMHPSGLRKTTASRPSTALSDSAALPSWR